MPQPKFGRIGRSPGAVERMSVIASLMSSEPLTSTSPPVRSTRSGKPTPVPIISLTRRRPSVDRHRGAFDRHRARALDVDLAALHRSAHLAVDGDVAAVDVDRAVLLQHDLRLAADERQLSRSIELERLLDGHLLVFSTVSVDLPLTSTVMSLSALITTSPTAATLMCFGLRRTYEPSGFPSFTLGLMWSGSGVSLPFQSAPRT